MNLKKNLILTTCLLISLLSAAAASAQAAAAPDFKAMLATIDRRSNFAANDFSARLRMVADEPGKAQDIKGVQMLRRDKEDKFLMLMLEPAASLGQGYLRIDDNLWFYDPESRKFTHSSMKESFQGTDAKNSDFSNSTLAIDYEVSASSEGKLGSYDTWILELSGKHNEVTYPSKKVWITKKDGLLLKSEDYSLNKRLLRTAYYTSYAKVDANFICDKVSYSDALVAGKKTAITMTDISTKAIPDSVFSKAYVEKVNH